MTLTHNKHRQSCLHPMDDERFRKKQQQGLQFCSPFYLSASPLVSPILILSFFRSVSSRPRDLIEVVRRGTSSIVVAASIREQAKHRENRTRTSGRIAVPSGSSRTRHLCNMHGSRIIQEHVLLVFSHQESSIALCCVACSPGRWPPIEGPGPLLAGISPSGCMDGQCLKRNHHHIA